MLDVVSTDPQEKQKAWLRAVLKATNLAPTALAQRAGVSQPTLTRLLNDPSNKFLMSARTISKIEAASGMVFGPEPRPRGFREAEGEPFKASGASVEADMIRAATAPTNTISSFSLRSRALECAGYLPGDIMVVDVRGEPRAGDVVCVQLYDYARGGATTAFRIFEAPAYLVSATYDPGLRKPIIVDDENVRIAGVVIASLRPRQSRVA